MNKLKNKHIISHSEINMHVHNAYVWVKIAMCIILVYKEQILKND